MSKRSLTSIAGVVAVATLVSKVFGLVRQQMIAAVFGVGPAIGAYNFAYVIPGFLLVLLGGINGPFHSAIVSALAKRRNGDLAPIIETITTLVGGVLLLLTLILVVFADPLMHLVAPGLYVSTAALEQTHPQQVHEMLVTRTLAVAQLRIMAPMALLAGLIGIGFGTLNAADQYLLPSLSPLFSSVAVVACLGGLSFHLGHRVLEPEYITLGGLVLAWATLGGAVVQWLAQLPSQWRSGLGGLRLRFNFRQPEVQEVIQVMGPATFSSGMMQINVWTDLFFASFIPQAAAAVSAMGYANLLVTTPLGILSNVILVPLLPVFSRLAEPHQWPELKQRIRQGLMMTGLTMLPLGALILVLSLPIVRVIYERYAFDRGAAELTASVLAAYSFGMFAYLARDVLVRVFYALGDGDTPFRISVVNIFLNAVLDFVMVKPYGAPGLILATVGVNVCSTVMLVTILHRRLGGLPMGKWAGHIAALTLASLVTGVVAWGVITGLERAWGTRGLLVQMGELFLAGSGGMLVFALITSQLGLPEVEQLRRRVIRYWRG